MVFVMILNPLFSFNGRKIWILLVCWLPCRKKWGIRLADGNSSALTHLNLPSRRLVVLFHFLLRRVRLLQHQHMLMIVAALKDLVPGPPRKQRATALHTYRRAIGLCYKCGEKWQCDHSCAPTVQVHMVQELWELFQLEDEGPEHEQVTAEPSDQLFQANFEGYC